MPRISVLGIGNVLMGDDAFGPYVVKLLAARYDVPPAVQVLELGTPGADLALHLQDVDAVVVVDTVKVQGDPGELRVLDKRQLMAKRPVLPASPHEPGLREALFTLEFRGGVPREVRLVGVIPGQVEMEVGLSPPVRAAVPAALGEVVRQLAELGAPAHPCPVPSEPDLWWERGNGGPR